MEHSGIIFFLICSLVSSEKIIHELGGKSGTVSSVNYPDSYPSDQDITWKLQAEPGFQIVLYFSAFDVEDSYEEGRGSCVYDSLEIIASNNTLHRFCGSSDQGNKDAPILMQEIHTKSDSISLRFISDYSNEEPFPKGFKVHYKTEDRDECLEQKHAVRNAYEDWDELIYCNHFCHNTQGSYYCSCEMDYHLHTNKHTCTSNCQGLILHRDTGKIQTPGYPDKYAKLSECDWTIKGKDGISIDFRFTNTFDVEEHYEEGCVYDWIEYEIANGKKSDKLCGNERPNRGEWIRTNSFQVQIMFHSDLTEEMAGFELEYKFNRVRCPNNLISPVHGKMTPTSKEIYEFEDLIEFSCDKGYMLNGQNSTVCRADQTWSNPVPTCKSIVCNKPTQFNSLPHVKVLEWPSSYTYGALLRTSCNEVWYEMTSGASDWVCGDNGVWERSSELVAPNSNDNLPECTPICGLKGNKKVLSGTFGQRSAVGSSGNRFPILALVIGKPAKYGEWPWMAFVDLFGGGIRTNEFCGGTLVSRRTVITAAHCTRKTYSFQINVYIGVSDRNDLSDPFVQSFTVAEMYEHPNYSDRSFDNDIAILILNKPVTIGKYARPICLPRSPLEKNLPELALSGSDKYQKTGIIAGWGVTERGYTSHELNMARIPPMSNKDCSALFEKNKPRTHEGIKITDNMLCAGYPDPNGKGRDSCQGDSGGPLMFKDHGRGKYFLLGIISFGSTEKCGQGTFGIHARMTQYLSWTDNYLKD